MTVKDLMDFLKNLPSDTEIVLYNNQYSGGDYTDLQSDPILLFNDNLDLVICDHYTQQDAKHFYGKMLTINELLR